MSQPLDIAIVGMAGCYPGAGNVRRYWQNILDKVDAVAEAEPDWIGPYFEAGTQADDDRTVTAGRGSSSIFLYPGKPFRVVDALVTNFHLPKSTLMLLVAAFAGKDRMMSVYRDAIGRGYRFYSFGDAMLIV